MVLPVLAALGITETVWIAVLGAIRLISWIIGIVYVTSYVKDTTTQVVEGQEQASQDATIEAILARTDISSSEKSALIQAYLSSIEAKGATDWGKTVLYAVAILAAAYIATSVIGGKK